MKRLRPFLVALQFLTRLPVHLAEPPDEREIGQSLLYYPLVGFLLGLMLAALAWAMRDSSSMLHAALLLAMWVLITGALHLDGFADSADAWVGGQGSRERTLAIMKDPYCGTAGAVALILLLLVKLAALEALAAQHQELPLVLAPLIGRTSLPALFVSTPYVRPGGLGEVLARQCPLWPTVAVVLSTVATIPLTTGMHSLWSLASAFATFAVLRVLMLRRLGGTTGDTAGAMVELVEDLRTAHCRDGLRSLGAGNPPLSYPVLVQWVGPTISPGLFHRTSNRRDGCHLVFWRPSTKFRCPWVRIFPCATGLTGKKWRAWIHLALSHWGYMDDFEERRRREEEDHRRVRDEEDRREREVRDREERERRECEEQERRDRGGA